MASLKKFIQFTLFIALTIPVVVSAQQTIHYSISWKGVQVVDKKEDQSIRSIYFEGAVYSSQHNFMPVFHKVIKLTNSDESAIITLNNPVFEPVPQNEIDQLTLPLEVNESLNPEQQIGVARGIASIDFQLIPLVKDGQGKIKRLVSFDLILTSSANENELPKMKSVSYSDHSVLSSGKWYKIKVNKSGICKITYDEIQGMGVDMSAVNPANIRVFGKPGGMLPENNSFFRYDDLPENAIQVVTATPGVFAQGDYILLYATSPDEVVFNATSRKFEHKLNLYSDYTYYFLNFDGGPGKRVGSEIQTAENAKYTCNTFMDFAFHETDQYNLIKSGKQWIGERLDFNDPSYTLPAITFTNVETIKQAFIRYRLVSRATTLSNFSITANANTLVSKNLQAYSVDAFSQEAVETKSFTPVEGAQNITVQYNTPNSSSLGYIDWVEVSVPRKMIFTGGQLHFADPVSVAAGNITKYKLAGADQNTIVWEVTDPVNIKKVDASLSNDTLSFVFSTDSIRQFVAWDNTAFNTVEFDGVVQNQDLHSIAYADMLIVSAPEFLEQANRLADHHRIVDGMTVVVESNQDIYNEFSSGSPDICAIRDFTRMLYSRPDAAHKLKYLLLFGDGSYDYKDHIPGNTNYVLAFETFESQNLVFSTASDDFFGLLDANEGADAFGKLDIGIGRFPVDNVEQAKNMVDKCIFYSSGMPDNLGEWRNSLCFIADDEDSNTHIRQVEDQVTPGIEKNHTIYNIDKIYLDAYTQVSTPSGARYPEVNKRINEEINKGVLIMNYTGHGGETGWAAEAILTLNDINSWTNYTHMPVFMTATCEFSRFDDPGRVSAGEQVFLNPAGGAVALLTTTRLANAGNNVELTVDLYDTIFSVIEGRFPYFGDVIAYAKNQNSGTGLIRNFMLIGDPAMHLAYPKYNVETLQINGVNVSDVSDTIRAMSEVSIDGRIADPAGQLVSSFNGVVKVKVFDKYKWMMTRGNDPTSYKRYFEVQENVLYQGTATVTNGLFSFSFIVPRDIDFSYGIGKISYYASNESTDAAGYCDSLVIGGLSNNSVTDLEGPKIKLYMNDERFIDGGITGENPMLLAYLSDESGLNTVGNGIGHDLVATIDGNSVNSIMLNDFYQADLDSYKSGKVTYNFSGLSEGEHSLELKAWDVFNNSSEATIHFVVHKNLALKLVTLKAYPNPFKDEVKVDFEHNLFNNSMDATLNVYSLNGSLIRTIGPQTFYSEGYHGGTLSWDGRNNNGTMEKDGVYVLRVFVNDGNSSSYKAITVIKATGQ
ncbi:MAG: type IX secretion system sortase PorU [Bacteroidetes bacterium]|nr:type IX secretion system sortase PorU [Bacteroidota bacterium]